MNIVPGDVVKTAIGWSISKMNTSMRALGGDMGTDLLVVATRPDENLLCVLTKNFGPTWVIYDSRVISVVR